MNEWTDRQGNPAHPAERPIGRRHGPEKRPDRATREKARARRRGKR